jgi:signal transduction histidine kinase
VSGKLRVNIGPCELTDVINAGLNAVRPAAEARGITVEMQLDPPASRAACDAVRIQQVVWNLVSNAIKFTLKGGRIGVTLSREPSTLSAGRKQYATTIRGPGPGTLHCQIHRGSAWRDGRSR